jgi:glycosyltransferase involved in cell wall biosynthesis
MARIIVVANSSWNLQHFRGSLIRELLRAGHRVTTLSPDSAGVRFGDRQVPHRSWSMDRSGTNPLRQLALVGSLRRIILEERPDVLFGFTIKPNIYGCTVCRLLGIPAVPNVTGLGTAFLGGSAFRRAILLMYRFAFSRAAAVFFQNKDDEALFLRERIVRPGQSRVLPGSGIDLDRFRPTELPEQPRFLMIARLLGDKGVREYAEAALKLRERVPAATFALLGELDSNNRSAIGQGELDSWVRDGILEYLGHAEDVRPHIARSMAVVLPS